jgi:hypothetical protein
VKTVIILFYFIYHLNFFGLMVLVLARMVYFKCLCYFCSESFYFSSYRWFIQAWLVWWLVKFFISHIITVEIRILVFSISSLQSWISIIGSYVCVNAVYLFTFGTICCLVLILINLTYITHGVGVKNGITCSVINAVKCTEIS